jgi:N-dimethylarginine dimethylaminohydrolase
MTAGLKTTAEATYWCFYLFLFLYIFDSNAKLQPAEMKNFHQFNETDTLKKIIIGRYDTYCQVSEYIERVNPEQEKGLPDREQLKHEFDTFQSTLEKENIEVFIPENVGKFVYDQLTPRDIGVTIGNKFLLCNMAKKSRRYEAAGIFHLLNKHSASEPEIVIPDSPTALMEGGDIIIDKSKIYVAETTRTNKEGIDFLKTAFGSEFDIIPVKLNDQANILHLDCIFNPVGKEYALIYEPAFKRIPREIPFDYELIPVTQSEQKALATNILSLSKNKVISRKHKSSERVNNLLREKKIHVIELTFDAAPSTGGSFRCCSLPLQRKLAY